MATADSDGATLERRLQTQSVRRFAPSPNGFLHLGHALSALTGFRRAKVEGGRFLLRIEDIDVTRCHQSYVDAIFEDLQWLGIAWDGKVLRQSEHFEDYREAAVRLWDEGLAYPCFASRAEIVAEAARRGTLDRRDPEGAPIYPGIDRALPRDAADARIARGEPFALRLHMERALAVAEDKLSGRPLTFREYGHQSSGETIEADPSRWGDVVVKRKDVPGSYHLAVVIDDARQGITEVTRGRDLYAATDVQRLLQVLLDLPEPTYFHHVLMNDPSGRKLAKSTGSTALRAYRLRGMSPAGVMSLIDGAHA